MHRRPQPTRANPECTDEKSTQSQTTSRFIDEMRRLREQAVKMQEEVQLLQRQRLKAKAVPKHRRIHYFENQRRRPSTGRTPMARQPPDVEVPPGLGTFDDEDLIQADAGPLHRHRGNAPGSPRGKQVLRSESESVQPQDGTPEDLVPIPGRWKKAPERDEAQDEPSGNTPEY